MIDTERLTLRPWQTDDLDPLADLCADPEVMRHLDGVRSRASVADWMATQNDIQAERGHCFWAMERRDDRRLLGFCGLRLGGAKGELEIGWRLRRSVWGRGYAREAAEASLAWGWANTRCDRIEGWTVRANTASWGLMIRLGMVRRPDLDFDHPDFPEGHPLHRIITHAVERHAHG
ncbi:GNAT family N-acetyltransferase [Sphingomonas mollis]|uniref:GNAT family N-acetyltransferase n=1 Tax=Sphingomonas mollis TaxID=2795726 RepID=A0ABS0XM94_9SPHN|nr:GNAT family N-acetyltransferase [Sphingomonas sp. BT553]